MKAMCQVLDITSKLIREDKIHWMLTIGHDVSPERIGIKRIAGEVNIYISTVDFDRISHLREQALIELRKQIRTGMIEDM